MVRSYGRTTKAVANVVAPSRVAAREAAEPPVRGKQRDDRERGQQPKICADVPVGRGRLERGKPAEGIRAEDLVEHLLLLLLEAVVEGARRHRAEDKRHRCATADEKP